MARPDSSDPTREGRAGDRRGFGRDGISGLLSPQRALRAREVSPVARPQPSPGEPLAASEVVDALRARASGRRR